MKKRTLTQLFTGILLITATIGCSQEKGYEQVNETILLDNGNKWSVHENMMVHIEQMASDVKATAFATDKDYSSLNTKLLANTDALTSDCTMKGQSHDELHKWLLPFIATANEYNSEMTANQSRDWFKEVQEKMEKFNTYFK